MQKSMEMDDEGAELSLYEGDLDDMELPEPMMEFVVSHLS